MKKILRSESRIRFKDCDPFNHLYNTCYLDYLLEAREDQIRKHYNLDVFANVSITGCVWVVSENQIAYIKPAHHLETVIINSQLIMVSPRNLLVEIKMWDKEEKYLKAFLWTKFSYFNIQNRKAALHSEELSNLFEQVLLPVEQTTFEERKSYLARTNHDVTNR